MILSRLQSLSHKLIHPNNQSKNRTN